MAKVAAVAQAVPSSLLLQLPPGIIKVADERHQLVTLIAIWHRASEVFHTGCYVFFCGMIDALAFLPEQSHVLLVTVCLHEPKLLYLPPGTLAQVEKTTMHSNVGPELGMHGLHRGHFEVRRYGRRIS